MPSVVSGEWLLVDTVLEVIVEGHVELTLVQQVILVSHRGLRESLVVSEGAERSMAELARVVLCCLALMLAFEEFHSVDRLLHGAHVPFNVFALVTSSTSAF